MQWARTGGLMTTYFCLIDSARRHTDLMTTRLGQFVASGGASVRRFIPMYLMWSPLHFVWYVQTLAFWMVWPFETLKNQAQAGTTGIGNTVSERIRYITATHGPLGLFRGIVPGTSASLKIACVSAFKCKALCLLQERAPFSCATAPQWWSCSGPRRL
jgi:hypothetical protein